MHSGKMTAGGTNRVSTCFRAMLDRLGEWISGPDLAALICSSGTPSTCPTTWVSGVRLQAPALGYEVERRSSGPGRNFYRLVKAPKVQPSDDAIQVKAAMEYLVTGHGSMGPAIALANRSMQARLDEVMP